MRRKKWETPIVTYYATRTGDLPATADHNRLGAQWLFSIPPHGGRDELTVRQGCMLVIRSQQVLRHLLQAMGQAFDTSNANTPQEIRELHGLGDLRLTRGGDLD